MSGKNWMSEEDQQLRDAALEEAHSGSGKHLELNFWETLANNQLLPRDRNPGECWERYKKISEEHTNFPRKKARTSQDIIPLGQFRDGGGDSEEITAQFEARDTVAAKSAVPVKSLGAVINFCGSERHFRESFHEEHRERKEFVNLEYGGRSKEDLERKELVNREGGGHSKKHRERKELAKLENLGPATCDRGSEPQLKENVDFPQVVSCLLSVAELPGIRKVLDVGMSGKFIEECVKKCYGIKQAGILREHLSAKVQCMEAKGLVFTLRNDMQLNEISEKQLYSLLDRSTYIFINGSNSALTTRLFRAVISLVKSTVLSGSGEVHVLKKLGSNCKSRFVKWKPFLNEDIFRSEMKSLKEYMIERYNGARGLSIDQLGVSSLLTSVQHIIDREEEKLDEVFTNIICLGQETEKNLASNLDKVKGNEADEILKIHLFSDDDSDDGVAQKRSRTSKEKKRSLGWNQKFSTTGEASELQLRTGSFSPREDKLLRQGIEQYGVGSWSRMQKELFIPNGFVRLQTSLKDRARMLGYVSIRKRRTKRKAVSPPLLEFDDSSS